ncbi:hypothetical protein GEMRC1_004095 [Eukaryota sp. GEM-RC1]
MFNFLESESSLQTVTESSFLFGKLMIHDSHFLLSFREGELFVIDPFGKGFCGYFQGSVSQVAAHPDSQCFFGLSDSGDQVLRFSQLSLVDKCLSLVREGHQSIVYDYLQDVKEIADEEVLSLLSTFLSLNSFDFQSHQLEFFESLHEKLSGILLERRINIETMIDLDFDVIDQSPINQDDLTTSFENLNLTSSELFPPITSSIDRQSPSSSPTSVPDYTHLFTGVSRRSRRKKRTASISIVDKGVLKTVDWRKTVKKESSWTDSDFDSLSLGLLNLDDDDDLHLPSSRTSIDEVDDDCPSEAVHVIEQSLMTSLDHDVGKECDEPLTDQLERVLKKLNSEGFDWDKVHNQGLVAKFLSGVFDCLSDEHRSIECILSHLVSVDNPNIYSHSTINHLFRFCPRIFSIFTDILISGSCFCPQCLSGVDVHCWVRKRSCIL